MLPHFARLPRGSHSSGHIPSTGFRHFPPNSARFSHATEGALRLYLNSARFSYATEGALRLYLRAAVHRRGQRPLKVSGTNMTRSNLAPKHARKHEAHPPRVNKRVSPVSIQTIVEATWSVIKQTSDTIRVVCNKPTSNYCLSTNKNILVS